MVEFKTQIKKLWSKLAAIYGGNIMMFTALTLGVFLLIYLIVFLFFNSSVPTTLTITTGEDGSIFQKNALKYKAILANEGITLNILPSEGSIDRDLCTKQLNIRT